MGKVFATVSLTVFLGVSQIASAGSINRLCADARIERLWFYSPDMNADGEKDLCEAGAEEIPAALAQAMQDQKEVQLKVTRLFDTDPAQAFPSGLRILMQWVISGADGTYEHPDLSIPDDRKISVSNGTTDKNILNKPVLAHEMTHWLLDSENPKIPAALRSINTSGLWSESIPDTVALAAYSRVSAPEPEIEQCLNIRSFDAPVTFKQTKGFFSHAAFFHQRKACCEKIQSNPKSSAASRAVCTDFFESNERTVGNLQPLDESPFDSKEAAKNMKAYNAYQMGIPYNSFLIELSKKIGLNVPALFLKAAKNISERKFSCSLPGVSKSVVVGAYSMLDVFQVLRSGLTSEQLKAYDQLALQFGFSALNDLENADMKLRIEQAAVSAFITAKPGQEAIVGRQHPCHDSLEGLGAIISTLPKQCQITMTPVTSR